MHTFRFHIVSVILLAFSLAGAARAQSILRDAETEAFFHEISDPLFVSAGLNPVDVKMFLLADTSLNAFVSGGQNIFINSGIIIRSDNVNQLLGVIAHEAGHIAGGHLTRFSDVGAIASNTSILSMVLGAAAILAGSPDAGIGLFMAGQSVALGQVLAYTRVQESSADQAGASYLEDNGISGVGLIEFFEKIRYQEILAQVRQDPYIRSHPLNSQRILALNGVVLTSKHYKTPPNPRLNEIFLRLKAKIIGYLYDPSRTLKMFPVSDTSAAARYARVYAYHKALEWDLALAEVDSLIAMEPENAYFHEIKGQILFENGKVRASLPVFEDAVKYGPEQPLIATALGQAMVSLEDPAMMERAIPILKNATRQDTNNSFAWFNLAKAYSWNGKDALASLATAERFYSAGVPPQAMLHAKRALDSFSTGTPEWLRAQDIFFVSKDAVDRYNRRNKRRRKASGFTFQSSTNTHAQ